MSAPEKPDMAKGWQFVEKLLDEKDDDADKKWLETASDEEIERRMDQAGVKVSRTPSPEALIARARERAARGADVATSKPAESVALARGKTEETSGGGQPAGDALGAKVRALPRRQMVARLTVGLALAAGAAVVIARQRDGGDSTNPPPPVRAAKLREEAFGECAAKRWGTCEQKLDEAKGLDPGGERDPRVVDARKAVAEAKAGGNP